MLSGLRMQHKSSLSTAALLLLCLWVNTAQSQTVYRVVDEQGKVTFTDNPERGGDAMTLAPLPSLPSASRPAAAAAPGSLGRPGQPFMPYDRFAIANPVGGAAVRGGMTPVEVQVVPPLREDHQIRLLVNGELSQSALHSDAFWLAGLSAGQHRLQAELIDSQGRVQHRTDPVTIFIAE
ncbi:DUF4124 domain-containing protein [Halomonas sp. DWK9]|uniref:DUF4124 domain-containing protein n=1 Tax=Halomonas sp. DWK9 TaxID=3060155 RepID=UPI00287FF06C|nr:DUF4124 domain-containing protein [Halomonas sp. DWK9]